MFSGQFYEKLMSVRGKIWKLLLEIVTYITITERDICIITLETVMCTNNGEHKRQYWYMSLLSSFANATDLYI